MGFYLVGDSLLDSLIEKDKPESTPYIINEDNSKWIRDLK